MKKRHTFLLILALIGLVLFTGCGPKPDPEPVDTTYKPNVKSAMVGTYTITPTWIPFSEPVIAKEYFDNQIAVSSSGQLFILDGNTLTEYALNGESYTMGTRLDLDKESSFMSRDNTDTLWISPGISSIIGVKNMQQTVQSTVKDYLAIAPDGSWGLTHWVSNPIQRVTNVDGNLSAEPWAFTPPLEGSTLGIISDIAITDTHVMIAGKVDEEERIAIYDYNGNLQALLGNTEIGNPDSLGSVTGMVETSNGFVAIDGNMRSIIFWTPDFQVIGNLKPDEVLGTDYPWLSDLVLQPDGSLLVAAAQDQVMPEGYELKEGEDEPTEILIFKLTGF